MSLVSLPCPMLPDSLSLSLSLSVCVCVCVCSATDSTTQNQTVVGMSSWMMHRNEDIFPNPDKFDPSRWLDPAVARVLNKHLVPFSRGQRQCLGMPYRTTPPLPPALQRTHSHSETNYN